MEDPEVNLFVRIEPLKAWHDITNVKFIVYLTINKLHFYPSLFHVLFFMNILVCIFYIVHDLGVLGVVQKIQVINSLQVDNLFIVGSWT